MWVFDKFTIHRPIQRWRRVSSKKHIIFLIFKIIIFVYTQGYPQRIKPLKIWRFEAWFVVYAIDWVFSWLTELLSTEISQVLAYNEPWMQENKFRTIVSSFVGNPVCVLTNYMFCWRVLVNKLYNNFILKNNLKFRLIIKYLSGVYTKIISLIFVHIWIINLISVQGLLLKY